MNKKKQDEREQRLHTNIVFNNPYLQFAIYYIGLLIFETHTIITTTKSIYGNMMTPTICGIKKKKKNQSIMSGFNLFK